MRRHTLLPALASTAAAFALAFAAGDPGGTVTPAADMETARMAHKIATLPDGDVLVVGGRGPGQVSLTTAELWHPQTNAWTQIDAAADQLDQCAIVRLSDGKYLVAGGSYDAGATPGYNSASLFDPATKTFTSTSSMTYRRFQCNGVQLAGGEVLIVGAYGGGGGASLYGEIYDTQTWSFSHTTGEMTVERSGPMVVPCADGTAFVLGGFPPTGGTPIERVESYDPTTNQFSIEREHLLPGQIDWRVVPSTTTPRATDDQRMSDGKYLLQAYRPTSGATEQKLVTFDPATKALAQFDTTPNLPSGDVFVIAQHPVIDRARGRAYIVGQVHGSRADLVVYTVNLATHELVVPTGAYHVPSIIYPAYAAATVLADGRLLLTGGYSTLSMGSAIATTFLVAFGGVPPPSPGLVRQFVLPTKIQRKVNAKNPAKDVLTLSATLDTGPDPAAFSASATLSIGGVDVPIAGLAPDRKGVWRSNGALSSFALVPGKAGSSRCTMTATLKGAQVLGVAADAAVVLSLSCGNVATSGGCTLTKGAFTLGRGALPAATSVPVSTKATLVGPGRDSFTVKWVTAPNTPPTQMWDMVFQFGATYAKTIPGTSFKKRGAVFTFADKTNVLPSVRIDTAKGLITVTGKKTDLGAFVEGAQAVRFTAGPAVGPAIVDVRMVRKGKTLTY